jgi:hypothetical protein
MLAVRMLQEPAAPQVCPDSVVSNGPELGDLRFAALLGPAWVSLPPAVQRRFSKRLAGGRTAVYVGEVAHVEASWAGRTLARLALLIGGPLPLVWTAPTASVVTVAECPDGGQLWTRIYSRPRGAPQVILSSKQFAGPTGLEERVGCGVGMALKVAVEDGVLTFRSAFYFVDIAGRRLRLPRWLEPGQILVSHTELGGGAFAFTLDVRHPLFGPLIRQHAVFHEDRIC